MAKLTAVLKQLQQERTRLTSQLGRLNSAISALTGVGYDGTRFKRRTISAAGRARIAAAQHARWAKSKGETVSTARRTRRPLSPAARKRIVAAQKARWASWRREQKNAA
jgi:hypothetical protein